MTDPYLDGRGVLKNLLGIADAGRLQQAEADFTKLRLFELEQGGVVSGAFDSIHLRALHHHLFRDLYAWAGHTRGDEISSGGRRKVSPALLTKGQTKFETSPRVNASLERVLESVARRSLRGLSVAEFNQRSADLRPTSTAFTRSARATVARSGLSCPSWLETPVIRSSGMWSVRSG